MFNHSVRRWIPPSFSDRELVKQFADSVDWLLSVDFPYSDKMASRFDSIKNKYNSIQDVPLEDVYTIIDEFGYSYITDTLNLEEDSLRTFLGFLNFIHMNKGTRKGLEFVFRLLDMEYEISEWWEQVPMGEQHTFNIDLLSFSPNNIRGFEIVDKLITFTRNYVYPIIQTLKLEFKIDNLVLNLIVVNQQSVDMIFYPDSIYLIWNVHNWDEKLWFFGINELIFNSDNWDEAKWSGTGS